MKAGGLCRRNLDRRSSWRSSPPAHSAAATDERARTQYPYCKPPDSATRRLRKSGPLQPVMRPEDTRLACRLPPAQQMPPIVSSHVVRNGSSFVDDSCFCTFRIGCEIPKHRLNELIVGRNHRFRSATALLLRKFGSGVRTNNVARSRPSNGGSRPLLQHNLVRSARSW